MLLRSSNRRRLRPPETLLTGQPQRSLDSILRQSAVDWAAGAGRVIGMMPHTGPENAPNIVIQSSLPIDGASRVGLIITDAAVIRVTMEGLILAELAPGWTVDDLAAVTGAPLAAAPDLKEMTFDVPASELVGKVFSSGFEAIQDLPDGAVVNIDGFGGPGGMAHYLLVTLRDHGAKDLTIISNTAGIARVGRLRHTTGTGGH